MNREQAQHIVASGMLTYREVASLAMGMEGDNTLSTSCSMFTRHEVARMILAALHGKQGRIDPASDDALFAVQMLVENNGNSTKRR